MNKIFTLALGLMVAGASVVPAGAAQPTLSLRPFPTQGEQPTKAQVNAAFTSGLQSRTNRAPKKADTVDDSTMYGYIGSNAPWGTQTGMYSIAPDGSTTGSIRFKMPKALNDGTEIDERDYLEYNVYVDGVLYESGGCEPGDTVSTTFVDLTDGLHVFSVEAIFDGVTSAKARTKLYIGNDIPMAPENVHLTMTTLTWDPVTTGINGGFVDASKMKYEVYLDGDMVESTSDTSLEIELPEGDLAPYAYDVYAVCNGMESTPAKSNTIVFGDPMEMPVYLAPDIEEDYLFTVFDANKDESTWHMRDHWKYGYFYSYYNDPVNEGDDWLFLPPVNFDEATATYYFSLASALGISVCSEEYFEVWVGNQPVPESMTQKIVEKTAPKSEEFEATEVYFTVPAAGTYYIGIKALSAPNQRYLNVKDFKVEKTQIADNAPAYCDNVRAQGAPGGALEATVTFNLPTHSIDGNAIPGSETLTATVTGASEVQVSGKPGQEVSATVTTVEGMNEISIVCALSTGEKGYTTKIQVYTGKDAPGEVAITGYTVSEDGKSITLNWARPENGLNGSPLPADLPLQYSLMFFNGKVWAIFPDDLGVDTNSYTYTYTPDIEDGEEDIPRLFQLRILAINEDYGTSPYDSDNFIEVQLGTPYSAPVADDFKDGAVGTSPLAGSLLTTYAQVGYGIANPADKGDIYSSENPFAMIGTSAEAGATGRLNLPNFETGSFEKYTVKMVIWTGENAASTSLVARCSGSEDIVIGEIPAGQGWQEVSFELPESLMNKAWVSLYLDSEFATTAQYFMLAGYDIQGTGAGSAQSLLGEGAPRVWGTSNAIIVSGAEGQSVKVYRADGSLLRSVAKAAETLTVPAAEGIYIVRANNYTAKVIVR